MNEKEFALLRRELEIIVPPGSGKVTPRVEVEVVKPARRVH